jgi:hypothetical protein
MTSQLKLKLDAMRLINGECEPDALGSDYHDAGSCWSLIRTIVDEVRASRERAEPEPDVSRRTSGQKF